MLKLNKFHILSYNYTFFHLHYNIKPVVVAGVLHRILHGKTTQKKGRPNIRKDHPRRKPAQCPWFLKVCSPLPGLMFHGQLVKFQTFFEDAFSGAGERARSNPLPVSPRRIRVLTNTHAGSNAQGRKVFSWSLSSGKHERCLAIKEDKNHVSNSCWIDRDEGQRQHEVIRMFYSMKIDFAYELFQHIQH